MRSARETRVVWSACSDSRSAVAPIVRVSFVPGPLPRSAGTRTPGDADVSNLRNDAAPATGSQRSVADCGADGEPAVQFALNRRGRCRMVEVGRVQCYPDRPRVALQAPAKFSLDERTVRTERPPSAPA